MIFKRTLLAVVAFLLSSLPLFAAPAFVQLAYKVPTSSASVAVPFAGAQTAHNLNVIVVGWSDLTASIVNPITDSNHNVYTLASGPTQFSGSPFSVSQAVYYAKD